MTCYRIIYCLTKNCNTLIRNDEGGYCIKCWNKKDEEYNKTKWNLKLDVGINLREIRSALLRFLGKRK